MNDVAIHIEGVSKLYHLGTKRKIYSTLSGAFSDSKNKVAGLFKKSKRPVRRSTNELWALKDVTLTVRQGEVVGLVGRNGAGKSTLLKILSRITEPTSGYAELHGRIGSLLEVGTGFHPELTGRDNIFMNGAILGMRRFEIESKFDRIVAFAEVEKFIDTPVKHYSSGMYLRLAFAVAAHLEPEILLVDEVLAVGDATFQKKCLGKMDEVSKQGRTVLFVSHNMAAVTAHCQRVVWLRDGTVAEDGEASEIVSKYLKSAASAETSRVWESVATAPGNDQVRLRSAAVRPTVGSPSDPITVRTPFEIEFEYWNLKQDTRLNLSVHVLNEQGITVFNTASIHEPNWHGQPFPAGLFRSAVKVPGDLLNDGMHRIMLLVVREQSSVAFRYEDVLTFEVQDSAEMRGDWHGKWVGAVRPNLLWETELVEKNSSGAADALARGLNTTVRP